MISFFSSLLKKFRKNTKGAAALEFAFVAIPFFWIVFGIIETGVLFFVTRDVEESTIQAARLIRTGQAELQGITQSQFKQKICDFALPILDCANKLYVDVRTYSSFSAITTPPLLTNGQLSQNVTQNQYDIGKPMSIVVVRVYYTWDLFTPGITLLADIAGVQKLIATASAFRNEPYGP